MEELGDLSSSTAQHIEEVPHVKVTLDKAYEFRGKVYGPGEAELPDNIKDEPITQAFKDAIENNAAAEAPKPKLADLNSVDAALASELAGQGYVNQEDLDGAKDADVIKSVNALDKDRLKEIRNEIKANQG